MMRRLAVLTALLGASCAQPQSGGISGPGESTRDFSRVHQLVRRLADDSLEEREKADAELIGLGPDELPKIREELDQARDPEVIERLKVAIQLLDEQDRLIRLVGRPRLVTLCRHDVPLSEVMAELARISGVPVDSANLPAELKVSLDASDVPVWIAIDDLCRSHGGIHPDWTADRVTILPGDFQETPHVEWKVGPIPMGRLQFVAVRSKVRDPRWSHTELEAVLLLAPGKRAYSPSWRLERAEDEDGKKLYPWERQDQFRSDLYQVYRVTSPGSIIMPVQGTLGDVPSDGAKVLRSLKGKLRISLSEGSEVHLAISGPLDSPSSEASKEHDGLAIRSWTRNGTAVKLTVQTRRFLILDGDFETPEAFRLIDASGQSICPVETSEGPMIGDMGVDRKFYDLTFVVPETLAISTFQHIKPHGEREIEIPFHVSGIPLK